MRHIPMRRLLVALSLLGVLAATGVYAQSSENTAAPPAASAQMPKPGSSMQAVKEKFGSPSQEIPAVGNPPISRWEYPGYVVYFEGERVLHTVIK
jgi:hypothetical protein